MIKNRCKQKRRFALALAFMLAVVNTNLSSGVVLAEEVETKTETEHHYDDNGFCTDEGCTDIYQPAQYDEEGDYYAIGNAGQLYWFANFVNVTPDNAFTDAKLIDDIVVNEGVMTAETVGAREWIPIGKNGITPYAGLFDGQMHSISGLYFNKTSEEEWDTIYGGLFGYMGLLPGTGGAAYHNCTVRNLCVKDSYFHAVCQYCMEVGVIGGYSGYYWNCCSLNNTIELENTHNSWMFVDSSCSYAGGIVGNIWYDSMRNCFAANNKFKITVPDETYPQYSGQLIGYIKEERKKDSVNNCYLAEEAGQRTGMTAVTAEQCKSGEAAWILNQGVNQPKADSEQNTIETLAWRQNLGENGDEYPVLDDTHGIVHLKDDGTYTNEHILIDVPGVEPTCTKSGLTDGKKCSGCPHIEIPQTEIPKKGHSFTNYVSSGTVSCERDGTMTAVCDNGCGKRDTINEPAKGHQPDGKYIARAFVHYQTCLVCGKNVEEEAHKYENCQKVDDSFHAGTCICGNKSNELHTWNEGVITKPATETETGTKTFTCTADECGAQKTVTIPVLSGGNEQDKPGNEDKPGDQEPVHTHSFKTNIVRATTKKAGSISEKCEQCGEERNSQTIPNIKTVKLSKSSCVYNGKTQKLSVTVKDSQGKSLKNGTDYTVSVPKSMKDVGSYKVTVTFKGNYEGTAAQTFEIIPQTTGIKKILPKSKGFSITWKKQTKQMTGYEIQYATDSKFKKNVKIVSGGKSKNITKKLSGLKAKKKYYVRIRTYKTVKGKKYCSSWSKAKTVKTKK